jgi:hypothetical protein
MYIVGVCHPPSTHDDDYNGFNFRASEMEDAAKALVGKPVRLEDQGDQIGIIIKAECSPDGALVARILVSDQTPDGKQAIEGVRSGEYKSLAVSIHVNTDVFESGKCTEIRPYEVSICKESGRIGCAILSYH